MKSERGNIVIYLLVGLALFAVLLTGLWWVKSQAPKTVAAPETTQTTTNTTPVSYTHLDVYKRQVKGEGDHPSVVDFIYNHVKQMKKRPISQRGRFF